MTFFFELYHSSIKGLYSSSILALLILMVGVRKNGHKLQLLVIIQSAVDCLQQLLELLLNGILSSTFCFLLCSSLSKRMAFEAG